MGKDLKDKTLDELESVIAGIRQCRIGLGQKKYLAEYIFNFIHAKDTADISQITPLSKTFRSELVQQGYFISQLKTIRKFTDPDGTIKYLFELSDANRIESVLLFGRGRKTLCLSTQAGCAMNCSFCATGRIRLRRNLTAAEIVDQVGVIQKEQGGIDNVVYMGMGEPLQNYEAVVKSLRILNHPAGKNIGIRRITVSTCGIVPAIKKLVDEDIHPRLAISLNAPTDSLRTKLMPINAKYPIKDVLAAAELYEQKAKQRVSLEYVMIKGVNDTTLHAQMLAKLLRRLPCRVNLIEFNPHAHCEFIASGKERIERFAEILEEAGIKTTVRFKMGQSIKAACGQLGADWSNA
jgi:23S rRNA (adenine2503-C2)-methyltransferase